MPVVLVVVVVLVRLVVVVLALKCAVDAASDLEVGDACARVLGAALGEDSAAVDRLTVLVSVVSGAASRRELEGLVYMGTPKYWAVFLFRMLD